MILNPYIFGGSFSPLDIAGCVLWLKADALSLSDGDPVATWADSSGQNNDATQSGSARPTYQTNELNGLPVVRFDGNNDLMLLTSPITSSSPISGFVVYKKRTTGVIMVPLCGPTASFSPYFINEYSNGVMYVSSEGNYTEATIEHTSFICSSTVISAGPSFAVWFNGSTQSLAAPAPGGNLDSFDRIGARATSECSDGDIAEIIIYDSALSTTNRQAVENFLMTKYAL
jgi:hypothetical protein